jgi:BirA family biotin operon repressor/biotin-[acetyl-CoA-carboxylase] ligase
LNVNQESFSLSTATSMAIKKEHTYRLNDVLAELLQWIEARYLQLRSHIDLKEEYVAALYGRGEKRDFKSGDESFEGIISGIDSVGMLEVETDMGKRYFDLKQIQFVS